MPGVKCQQFRDGLDLDKIVVFTGLDGAQGMTIHSN